MARASVFQTDDEGSIPFTRSMLDNYIAHYIVPGGSQMSYSLVEYHVWGLCDYSDTTDIAIRYEEGDHNGSKVMPRNWVTL